MFAVNGLSLNYLFHIVCRVFEQSLHFHNARTDVLQCLDASKTPFCAYKASIPGDERATDAVILIGSCRKIILLKMLDISRMFGPR